MLQLHLPWPAYDLFVYDFGTIFQEFEVALSYYVYVYILYDHPVVSFGHRMGQSLQRPCGDHMETAQSLCNPYYLRTKIAQCPYDVLVPYDYLKSL